MMVEFGGNPKYALPADNILWLRLEKLNKDRSNLQVGYGSNGAYIEIEFDEESESSKTYEELMEFLSQRRNKYVVC